MGETVVAFARRDRVVLGLVVREDAAPPGLARVEVAAEDGARFALPADQVFARFPTLLAAHVGGSPAERLGRLRGDAAGTVAWSDVHRAVPAGTAATFDDLAAALGAADERGRLRVALALSDASPWLRREGAAWVVVPREEAVARIARAEATRRAEREDRHLRDWWPRRRSEPLPACAAGAAAAMRDFAFRGEVPSAERGRLLAAHVEISDPDQALEALVECGVVAPGANPAPARAGLDDPFPADALAEARARAGAADGVRREDLTALHAVSVDDDETVEVDDAISVRRLGDDVEILVHISDATALVPPGGALDAAVRARASSLYLPEGPVTMLPGEAVAGAASLDAGVVRAAVTGAFVVRPDGTVASARFFRSLVRVTRRLRYEDTADPGVLAAAPQDARALCAAAQALRAARIRGGAVVTGLPSLKVRVRDGAPVVERRMQDAPGDLVVGETAVLYNAQAGRAIAARDVAALFRTQDAPRSPEPDPASPLWPVLVRRRFSPTHLRVEPARHHGVGCDAYAQATSPMRRYADLVNQRQLVAVAEGTAPPHLPADLESLAEHLSARERAVRRASAWREDHWVARWILARGVREIDGVLVRAPRRGLGGVWCDELLAELPLRAPDRWRAPPEGTRASWKVERVLPWRGRVELAPPAAESAGP